MAGLRKYIRPYYSYMLLAMFIKFFWGIGGAADPLSSGDHSG